MLEKEQEHLHFILHDAPEPPRLLVVSKKTLARFTILLPLCLVAMVLVLLAFAWFKAPSLTRDLGKLNLPSLPNLSQEETRIRELEGDLKAMEQAVAQAQAKLNAGVNTESEIWLGPIKRPYALQDLTAKNLLRLEDIALESDAKQQILRFNLVNAGPESQKVTGHIFVLHLQTKGLGLYPAPKLDDITQGIRFNEGESFSVSRLRPVEAPFASTSSPRFLVLIFSREGDLLVRQELTGPFKNAGAQ